LKNMFVNQVTFENIQLTIFAIKLQATSVLLQQAKDIGKSGALTVPCNIITAYSTFFVFAQAIWLECEPSALPLSQSLASQRQHCCGPCCCSKSATGGSCKPSIEHFTGEGPLWAAFHTSASALTLAAACHSKTDHSYGAYEELATV